MATKNWKRPTLTFEAHYLFLEYAARQGVHPAALAKAVCGCFAKDNHRDVTFVTCEPWEDIEARAKALNPAPKRKGRKQRGEVK